ncbi:hypothetical protein GOBAR_AA39225 [Gossypium barbadense]|uniref:Uncharacterized protein n=1 Tax=Gossypium barbadense TaxID=3634 RepID=A0A2P5VRL1_GOSBA|nr:hypothetical protein GOBAR_AA39225 [Gossypium barbadense]
MSSSRRKKTAVLASKKRKGALSSAGPTAKIRHPLLQFPRGPQEKLFQILQARPLILGRCIDWAAIEQVQMAIAIRALLTTDPWELFFRIIEPTYLELTMELCSTFHIQTVMTSTMIPARSSERRMNYMLSVATYISLPRSAGTLWPLARPRTILAAPRHQFSHIPEVLTRYFSSHDYREAREHWRRQHPRRLLLIVHVVRHQTERHKKGVISMGPYVTRLARHFGLLNTAAQESSITLIGQMSPEGISSRLSMRMIERCRGTYPP